MKSATQPSWPEIPLGDVVTLHYGKALDKQDRDPNGSVPVYGANGIKDRSNISLTSGPSLVVGRKGSAGEITRVDGPFWPLDVSYYTSHDADRLDFNFLEYALRTLDLPSMARGVKPGINRNDVYALPIPLPAQDEQKRIVAVLDQAFAALDRARAHAEANLADCRKLFAVAVSAVVKRKSDNQQQKLRLGSIVTRLTNGYVGPISDVYVESGIPYLLARQVRDNTLAFDGRTYVSQEFNDKHKKSKLKAGDVLLVQSGHIGHSAVVPREHEGHNCHAMIVITPVEEIVSGSYLSTLFNTPEMQDTFQNIRTGSTVPHLTCKMVKELMIELPPRRVQDEIIQEIENLKARIEIAKQRYKADVADLANLRQSLLQKAFSGQLT